MTALLVVGLTAIPRLSVTQMLAVSGAGLALSIVVVGPKYLADSIPQWALFVALFRVTQETMQPVRTEWSPLADGEAVTE